MPAFLAAVKDIPGVINASSMVGNVLGGLYLRQYVGSRMG